MLTTIDNPFDPFEQFTSWLMFDKEKGYDSCERLARLANITSEMSQKEIDDAMERAIDRLIELDVLNIYKRVFKKSTEDSIDTDIETVE
jgi:hypothetical protein